MGRLRRLLELRQSDNPLLRYYDPRRRNLPGLAFRASEVVMLLAVIVMAGSWFWGMPWGPPDVRLSLLSLMEVLAAGLIPALFLFVAPGPWPHERSIELRLTGMKPRDVAVGFLFWPLVMLGGLALAAGLVWMSVGNILGWFRSPLQSFGFHASLFAQGFSSVLVLGAYTLAWWFTNGARRWAALLLAPCKFLLLMWPLRGLREGYETSDDVVLGVLMMAWGAATLSAALSAAGIRILGKHAAGADLLRVYPLARDRDALPPASRWNAIKYILRFSIPAALLLVGIMIPVAYRLPDWAQETEAAFNLYGGNRHATLASLSFIAIAIFVCTLTVLLAARSSGWTLPVCSGALRVSLAGWAAPMGLAVGVPWILMNATVTDGLVLEEVLRLILVGLIAGHFVVDLLLLMLIPRRGRKRIILLIAAILIGFVYTLGAFVTSGFFDSWPPILYGLIIGFCPFLFRGWFLERLARLELTDVPIGRFNTDPPSDEPVVPDWIVDELASGRR